jgi:hypothetical protein
LGENRQLVFGVGKKQRDKAATKTKTLPLINADKSTDLH